MAGNGPRSPHFHVHSSGWGYVEHEHHQGLPDRRHVHEDDQALGPSVDEEPMPPGMAERPRIPSSPPARLWLPGQRPPRRH
jgi:hypothetical protein